jgi:hypothetical protein
MRQAARRKSGGDRAFLGGLSAGESQRCLERCLCGVGHPAVKRLFGVMQGDWQLRLEPGAAALRKGVGVRAQVMSAKILSGAGNDDSRAGIYE